MATDLPLERKTPFPIAALGCWLGFALTALWVLSGQSAAFDANGLALWRKALGQGPVGPLWLTDAMLVLTAIGGWRVRLGCAALVCGYLGLRRRYRAGCLLAATALSAALANAVLKQIFLRPRPSIDGHLTYAAGLSFPSGHAFNSAAVFLAMAMALTMANPAWPTQRKRAVVAGTLLLATLIAFSRVWLGVHYPTDAIAGLLAGTGWTLTLHWLANKGPGGQGPAGTRPTSQRN